MNTEILYNISNIYPEMYELSILFSEQLWAAEAQSSFVFMDFCHNLSVNLKSMVYLYFFCSNAVDDAPINCVLSHFPALDFSFCEKLRESKTNQQYKWMQNWCSKNVCLIIFKTSWNWVFHHMKCNNPRRMSVMDYFGESAWTVFKTDQPGLWLQTILK